MSSGAKVLVVVGMHRSGTSLTANWLEKCGLDMGDDLLQLETDNPTGHYEDLSFLRLHVDILRENGLDYLVDGKPTIEISEKYRAHAQTIINAKQARPQWGWKDPRTVLFLDFWHSLLPDMNALVVYRHYTHVVDSLLRREYKQALREPKKLNRWQRRLTRSRRAALLRRIPGFLSLVGAGEPALRTWRARLRYSFMNVLLVRRYLRVWARYNEDILAFVAAHPEQALVIHIDDLFSLSAQVVDYFNHEWHFHLEPVTVEEAYADGMLRTERLMIQKWLCALMSPACRRIYRELANWRAKSLHKLTNE